MSILPLDSPTLAWLATYWMHSAVLLTAALLAHRFLARPAARELLARGALIGGVATASLTLALARPVRQGSGPRTRGVPIVLPDPEGRLEPAPGGSSTPAGAILDPGPSEHTARGVVEVPWTGLVLTGWLVTAGVLLAALAREQVRLRRGLAARRRARSPELRLGAARVGRARGGRVSLRLTECPGLATPIALGRREICLPQGVARELAPDELEALLAHELAHLARRDPLWLLALHALERILWVQPLNRLVRERWQADAELCCDDWAAERSDPRALARCLARAAGWLERAPAASGAPGMAASSSGLVGRVERLLAPRAGAGRAGRAAPLALGAALLGLALAGPSVPVASARQDEPVRARLLPPSGPDAGEGRVVRVEIGAGGAPLALDGRALGDLEELERRLRATLRNAPLARVVLAPSAQAPAELLRSVVDLAHECCAEPVSVEGDSAPARELARYALERAPAVVVLQVVASGRRLDPDGVSPWSGRGPFLSDGTRRLAHRLGSRVARDLDELALLLAEHRRAHPWGEARIEAGPGCLYDEVRAALERVRAAGFQRIRFASPEPRAPVAAPEPWAAVLEVGADGTIAARGQELSRGEAGRDVLEAWLGALAAGMRHAPAVPGGPELPDERVLIQVDERAPFRQVLFVMESCGRLRIRKLELACAGQPVPLPVWLPVDAPGPAESAPALEVTARVRASGAAAAARTLEAAIGEGPPRALADIAAELARKRERSPRARVLLSFRAGVEAGEALTVVGAVVAAGFTDIAFAGAHPESREERR